MNKYRIKVTRKMSVFEITKFEVNADSVEEVAQLARETHERYVLEESGLYEVNLHPYDYRIMRGAFNPTIKHESEEVRTINWLVGAIRSLTESGKSLEEGITRPLFTRAKK